MPTLSLQEMQTFAQELLPMLLSEGTLLLKGDLGAGKTTMTQYLAKELGIEQTLHSPTYPYVNRYKLPKELNGYTTLQHFDLYRLPEHSEDPERVMAEIGLAESLENPKKLSIIEWPERLFANTEDFLTLLCEQNDQHHAFELHQPKKA